MFLALKEMKKEKGRFLLIISIVILISYLVFFLLGLSYGLSEDNKTAIDNWNADRIVLKAGSNTNILSSSMGKESSDDFKGHDISLVNVYRNVVYKGDKEDEASSINVVIMGLEKDSKAYPKLIEGKLPSNDNQALASETMKRENNIKVGDYLKLSQSDKKIEITGFVKEAKYSVASVVYMDLDAVSKLMSEAQMQAIPKSPNMQVGQQNPKMTAGQENAKMSNVQQDIRISGILIHDGDSLKENDKYNIVSKDKFIDKLPGYMPQVLTFALMIGFLILISSIVLGVFMYIITIQKRKTFGVMKIQGISSSYISKSVISQTFIVNALGIAIGLGLTYLSKLVLPVTMPFKSDLLYYLIIALIMIVTSLLGAIFSVRGVSKIDPLEVLD